MVEAERKTLETITRNEGKPEAALPKIVEGRLNGFFKDVCLLEQPYAKDDKQSIKQVLGGSAMVTRASPKSKSADPHANQVSMTRRWQPRLRHLTDSCS